MNGKAGLGWLLAAALVGTTGCDDELFGIADDETTIEYPEGYAGVQQIVADSCLACHSAAAAPSAGFGLDLETDLAGATVGVSGGYGVALVTPNDAENSMLYMKLAGTNPDGTGGTMPPGAPLGAGAVAVVGDWIDAGATTE